MSKSVAKRLTMNELLYS